MNFTLDERIVLAGALSLAISKLEPAQRAMAETLRAKINERYEDAITTAHIEQYMDRLEEEFQESYTLVTSQSNEQLDMDDASQGTQSVWTASIRAVADINSPLFCMDGVNSLEARGLSLDDALAELNWICREDLA